MRRPTGAASLRWRARPRAQSHRLTRYGDEINSKTWAGRPRQPCAAPKAAHVVLCWRCGCKEHATRGCSVGVDVWRFRRRSASVFCVGALERRVCRVARGWSRRLSGRAERRPESAGGAAWWWAVASGQRVVGGVWWAAVGASYRVPAIPTSRLPGRPYPGTYPGHLTTLHQEGQPRERAGGCPLNATTWPAAATGMGKKMLAPAGVGPTDNSFNRSQTGHFCWHLSPSPREASTGTSIRHIARAKMDAQHS